MEGGSGRGEEARGGNRRQVRCKGRGGKGGNCQILISDSRRHCTRRSFTFFKKSFLLKKAKNSETLVGLSGDANEMTDPVGEFRHVDKNSRICVEIHRSVDLIRIRNVPVGHCRKGNVNSHESPRQLHEGGCTAGVEEGSDGISDLRCVTNEHYLFSVFDQRLGSRFRCCFPYIKVSLSMRNL